GNPEGEAPQGTDADVDAGRRAAGGPREPSLLPDRRNGSRRLEGGHNSLLEGQSRSVPRADRGQRQSRIPGGAGGRGSPMRAMRTMSRARFVTRIATLSALLLAPATVAMANWTATGQFTYVDREWDQTGFTGNEPQLPIRSADVQIIDSKGKLVG